LGRARSIPSSQIAVPCSRSPVWVAGLGRKEGFMEEEAQGRCDAVPTAQSEPNRASKQASVMHSRGQNGLLRWEHAAHAELHQRGKIRRDASAAVLCLDWPRKEQRNLLVTDQLQKRLALPPSLSGTYHLLLNLSGNTSSVGKGFFFLF
jgi:hypothetical protein